MSRYLEHFPEEIIIKVLRAYLIHSESHRSIQKNILGLPAPARGGGFIAMDILHAYDIKGEHKGILSGSENYETDSNLLTDAIRKVQEYNNLERLAKDAITTKNASNFDSTTTTEIERTTKQRIGQDVLRNVVLDNYSGKCALCEIHQNDLLICSHIIPWTIDTENRLNPSNAIALCKLHDGLFDKGYFSLNEKYEVILSDKSDSVIKELMEGKTFRAPHRNSPGHNFLNYHREEVCE